MRLAIQNMADKSTTSNSLLGFRLKEIQMTDL